MDRTKTVHLNYGANGGDFENIVGWSIRAIKQEFSGGLGVPANATAFVVGTGFGATKPDSYCVKAGDHVSFQKPAGNKA